MALRTHPSARPAATSPTCETHIIWTVPVMPQQRLELCRADAGCVSVCLSVCLSVYPSVCLCVRLSSSPRLVACVTRRLACVYSARTYRRPTGEVVTFYADRCPPQPRGDLLAQKNPTCACDSLVLPTPCLFVSLSLRHPLDQFMTDSWLVHVVSCQVTCALILAASAPVTTAGR
jgi:hypothetical protein